MGFSPVVFIIKQSWQVKENSSSANILVELCVYFSTVKKKDVSME